MGKRMVLLLWMTMMLVAAAYAANKQFTLVIDAGHGGHDAGALGAFSKEKDINLSVATAFGQYVERNCPDVKVVYTRRKDVFVPLHERANIANRNKADLFISIHTNALPNGKTARGMETYTLGMHRASDNFDVAKRENSVILFEKDYEQHYEGFDPRSSESYIMFEFLQDKNMAQSVELARLVQKKACASASRPNKGVRQAGFLVLRETSMPSCLVELGFITTADEERYLNSAGGVDALAQGIFQAFQDYKQKYDKNLAVPYQTGTRREMNIPTVVPEEAKSGRERKKRNAAEEKAADRQTETRALVKETEGRQTDGDGGKEAETDKAVPDSGADIVAEGASDGSGKQAAPVFKVQILASGRNLRPGSQQFKGTENVECYEENGMYKYTCGSSTDYNEINRLCKVMLDRFPGAFVIAFKNDRKVNVVEAIREFKQNRNKKQ